MDEGFNIFAGPETEQAGPDEPERSSVEEGSNRREPPLAVEREPDGSDAGAAERDLFGSGDSSRLRRPRPRAAWRGRLRTFALGAAAIVMLALAGALFGSGGRGTTEQRTAGPPAPTVPPPHEPAAPRREPQPRAAGRSPRRLPDASPARTAVPRASVDGPEPQQPVVPVDDVPAPATPVPAQPPVPATAPQPTPPLPAGAAAREFGFER